MQNCLNCGTPLLSDAAFCPQCGTVRLSQQPSPDIAHPSGGIAPQPSNPFQGGAISSTPPPPAPFTPSPASYAPSSPTYGMSAYSQNSPSYSAPGYPQTPLGTNSSPYYPAPPSSPAIQPHRGFSKTLLTTTIVLVVVLIISGIGLIYYSTVIHPQQLQAQATANAQQTMTANTLSTATANALATGTAQVQATATVQAQVTALAKATSEAQATATALQNIYTQATSGTPAINDSLSAQSSANWETYVGTQGGGCAFTDGALHSKAPRRYYDPCIAQSSSFGNFAIEVNMTLIKGDGAGVILHADQNAKKGYIFYLTSDGHYGFDLLLGDNQGKKLLSESSPIIHTGAGQSNTLTAIARENSFYLYINKKYVESVSDNSFSSGKIAVAADARDNDTEAAFSNLRVWQL